MKKTLGFLCLLLTASIVFPFNTFAKVMSVERGVATIAKDEVINDDLFVGGETVQIDGTINGDVYAGGEMVRVTGTVNGDLHIGAGRVEIRGATIGDSLLVGAGEITIDDKTTIGGSILAGSGSLIVNSPVKRNIFAGAGTIELNSTVDGESRFGAGKITLGPNAKVGKDLYYAIGDENKDIRIAETASVAGMTQRIQQPFTDKKGQARETAQGVLNGARIFGLLLSLLGAILVGYLGLKFFPNLLAGSSQKVSTEFLKSLVVGFLITVAAIPVLIVIAITVVGFPLAGILFLLLLLGFYLSKYAVGLSLGQWLSLKLGWKKISPLGILATGLLVIYLLKLVPVIGFLASLVVVWAGLGALALYFSSNTPRK